MPATLRAPEMPPAQAAKSLEHLGRLLNRERATAV